MMELAEQIERRLRAVGTPERATAEKAYLKSSLDFLGAPMPAIRREVRVALRGRAPLGRDEVVTLVLALSSRPIHERRMAAIIVLERRAAVLSPADLPLIERLIRESGTWALVDGLAASVLARMVETDPDGLASALDRWATDDDFWVRRASLLAELRLARGGDAEALDRFGRRADPMLEEREFFVRKAIGWVLREAGRRRPDGVMTWLAPRTHRASGVTMREAVKHLPTSDRDRLMAAHREGRAA